VVARDLAGLLERLDVGDQPLARALAARDQEPGAHLRIVRAGGHDLRSLLDALRDVGQLVDEPGLVIDDLELQARRLADDVADLLERRLIGAGDLDDDVGALCRDGRLAQAERVDAVTDGLARLLHGGLADLVEEVGADVELHGAAAALHLAEIAVTSDELVVELGRLGRVLEGEHDPALTDVLDRHALVGRRDLLARRRVVLGDQAEQLSDLALQLIGAQVAAIANRLLDLDLVHQPQTALDVETRGDAALEELRHRRRYRHPLRQAGP
jgi:hypothetical protein